MEGAHVTNTPLVSRIRVPRPLALYINVILAAWPVSQLMHPSQTAMALQRVQRPHISPTGCLLPNHAKRNAYPQPERQSQRSWFNDSLLHQIHSRLELNTRHSLSHTPPTSFCFTVKNVRMSKAGRYAGHTSPLEDQKFAKQKIYTKRESNPPRVLDSVGN